MSSTSYGRQSGLAASPATPSALGTKIFSKASNPANPPTVATENGDTLRYVKNRSTSTPIYLAETQAKSIDTAQSWYLGPGESLVLLGPAGIGWGGDLYACGDGVAVLDIFRA